mmetsp:Transcript_58980/g.157680  ORF Transcript_58980/g.157680 Transcript_58980/m.157680 type:complete len:329 (-) Transcript_58980:100-1086(-)
MLPSEAASGRCGRTPQKRVAPPRSPGSSCGCFLFFLPRTGALREGATAGDPVGLSSFSSFPGVSTASDPTCVGSSSFGVMLITGASPSCDALSARSSRTPDRRPATGACHASARSDRSDPEPPLRCGKFRGSTGALDTLVPSIGGRPLVENTPGPWSPELSLPGLTLPPPSQVASGPKYRLPAAAEGVTNRPVMSMTVSLPLSAPSPRASVGMIPLELADTSATDPRDPVLAGNAGGTGIVLGRGMFTADCRRDSGRISSSKVRSATTSTRNFSTCCRLANSASWPCSRARIIGPTVSHADTPPPCRDASEETAAAAAAASAAAAAEI